MSDMINAKYYKELADSNTNSEPLLLDILKEIENAANNGEYNIEFSADDHRLTEAVMTKLRKLGFYVGISYSCVFLWDVSIVTIDWSKPDA